ncbi:RNase P and RNase MRP subunit [Scheffersomyces coipomensis]|uniref:RNase P and RNase MRP subunit n=1 Tax=Scheffersomyces coipomensis TaxID=1788519 RepID=UPI00315DD6B8
MDKNNNKKQDRSSSVKKPAIAKNSLKELEKKRRQVFKPILDNPFTQSSQWPFVSPDIASQIIDHLSFLLSSVGKHNELKKQQKSLAGDGPQISKQIVVGFNAVVSALESQAQVHKSISNISPDSNQDSQYIKYIFVTKNDISPPIIISSFPVLAYTSSRSESDRVKLIQLPKGTMEKLSSILSIPNTGILGMAKKIPEAFNLFKLIDEHISDVDIPWLHGLFDRKSSPFLPPVINFLSTSAPILPKKNDQKKKAKANND